MKCKCGNIMKCLRECHVFDAVYLCEKCGRTATLDGEFIRWTKSIKEKVNE